jgi:hypothetical protein
MKYHKWINTIASATFGVYLIHDNNIIRSLLWIDWFNNAKYQDSLLLIPYSVFVVTVVYVVCSAIDLLRQHIVEAPYMRVVERHSSSAVAPLERLVSFIVALFFGKQS